MNINVVTLNTWLLRYFDKVIEFIQDVDPEILLLQEVTSNGKGQLRDGEICGLERLNQKLGLESRFEPMWRMQKDEAEFDLGVAILSKLPIRRSQANFFHQTKLELSWGELVRKPDNFPSLLLGVEVEVGGRPIEVLTTHFIWSLYPEELPAQVKAADTLLKLLEGKDNLILGGDFNLTDASQVYRKLTHRLIDDRPPGTTRTIHPQIHKVKEMELAVDYLFHRGEGIKLLSSEVPMVGVSDHLPIVAHYDVR